MSINNINEKMNIEIDRRMNSNEWNYAVASKVITLRNKNIKRNIFSISTAGLAATAAVIIFAVNINTPSIKNNDLDIFITKQVDETHKQVFKESTRENLLQVDSDENINSPIFHLVDTALSVR